MFFYDTHYLSHSISLPLCLCNFDQRNICSDFSFLLSSILLSTFLLSLSLSLSFNSTNDYKHHEQILHNSSIELNETKQNKISTTTIYGRPNRLIQTLNHAICTITEITIVYSDSVFFFGALEILDWILITADIILYPSLSSKTPLHTYADITQTIYKKHKLLLFNSPDKCAPAICRLRQTTQHSWNRIKSVYWLHLRFERERQLKWHNDEFLSRTNKNLTEFRLYLQTKRQS